MHSCQFVSAHFSTKTCEIYADGENGTMVAYVPAKAKWEGKLELGTDSFAKAELTARACGLEPKWGV